MDLFAYDRNEGVELLCGVDEAGRGPLAGSVYAAACILPPDIRIEGLNDSKQLTARRREQLYEEIREKALSCCVATATVEEIEALNILNATFLAMRRAVEGLSVRPQLVLVDGNRNPQMGIHSRCVVKGDATSACIAAASILAKVERDRYMERLAQEYPQYRFEQHKGYGTALHYRMLDEFGPSPVHRLSFLKKYQAAGARKTAASQSAYGGQLGEDAAAEWLQQQGYTIEARNYRCREGEIDIIARSGRILSFTEVKTRTEGSMLQPRDAVTPAKQRRIVTTALQYLAERGEPGLQPRFDVIEVTLSPSFPQEVRQICPLFQAFGGEVLGDGAF